MSTTPSPTGSRDELARHVAETAIRLGVLALLAVWCFQILQPFITPIVWGIIIAVAIFPLYRRLADALGDRPRLAAVLVTIGFFLLLLVPGALLTQLLVENVTSVAGEVRSGRFAIPPLVRW